MKFSLNRLDFLRAAKQLCRVAPETNSTDIITGILLEADADNLEVTMTATNIECTLTRTLPAAVHESGRVVVNAALFAQMLRLFGEASVTVALVQNEQLSLACGKARYTVATRPANDFPSIPVPPPTYTAEIADLPAMVKTTAFLASRTGTDMPRRCVRLDIASGVMRAASTDGTRLMLCKKPLPVQNEPQTLLIPVAAFTLLASLVGDDETLKLSSSPQYAVFENHEMTFTARLGHGNFIDVDSVISSITGCYEAIIDSKDLHGALEAFDAAATAGDQLHIVFQPDQIALASNSEQALCRTKVAAQVRTPMPPEGFYYPLKKLLQGLLSMNGLLRLSVSTAGYLIVTGAGQTYFQTPARYQEKRLKVPGQKEKEQEKSSKEKNKTSKKKTTKTAAKAA